MSGVSVLILTKNEENDLPGCMESVIEWCDDIHVYDSFSTDRTVEIASRLGARVTRRQFDNWASHQNWGLANIKFKHEWVLYLDADERITPALAKEILAAAAAPGDFVAFDVRRRDFYRERWLKHVQATPYYIRLFKPAYIQYDRLVNPVTIVNGKKGRLSGYLDHQPFSKGIAHWVSRHNSYSSLEADQLLINESKSEKFELSKALLSRNFEVRRYHQKGLFSKLPFRPLLKFFVLYVVRRGFLDGGPGFSYALLQSIYEYFIVLKVDERLELRNAADPLLQNENRALSGDAQT
ncbi:glycosyltransferase involved in cell wall biosynthesis [Trinickia symbiotica]|uniref:Glycosyltransferase family 2 protein n=1 Tax=Trinickia symbiotica TaxID=863227 RepID=A0A2N7X644_9BURK|nr:glycosyltransferase family 2 protein [Trinickia symbiotica]PMS37041.1 glycosyltransferase family 2 protein [Trinickia symbiotica]PPK43025.1 glycosyltransferase involved in cell wall biosynthesis [Trinickia symbiotica]